jgi:hypothetical protein
MRIPETEITVCDGAGSTLLRRTVKPGEYVLGSAPEAALCFKADLVCEEHAKLTINYDHIFIEDLDSAWGTFVNGKPIQGANRLWPGQRIQIGTVSIECRRVKPAGSCDDSLSPAAAAVGEMLPEELLHERKYEIAGVIAEGGMGAILDATEQIIERKVAMKVMLNGSDPRSLEFGAVHQ